MEKMAIFVEGQTEQVFAQELVYAVAGRHRVHIDSVRAHGGRAIKSTGDGFLATFDGPARAVRCAKTIGQQVSDLGIELRAGLHTGEIEVIGADVGGMAVHISAAPRRR